MNSLTELNQPKPSNGNLITVSRLAVVILIASLLVIYPQAKHETSVASAQQPLTFISVATGNDHTLALSSEGLIYSWGRNNSGQLGDGTTSSRTLPGPVSRINSGELTFSALAASGETSYALANDGRVFAWGQNNNGQLGDGSTQNRSVPTPVSTSNTFSQIAAGSGFAIALTDQGVAWSWGFNTSGNLGDGTRTGRVNPVTVSTALTFSKIAAGGETAAGIAASGSLYAWGSNNWGGVGDNSTGIVRDEPTAVSTQSTGVRTFNDISVGLAFVLAASSDGSAFSWGLNLYGNLGDNSKTNRGSPVLVSSQISISKVAAGSRHSIAIDKNGSLLTWGANFSGQLGDGSFVSERLMPGSASTASSGALQFSKIVSAPTANGHHSFALSTDGKLFGWGDNSYGELGTGDTVSLRSPTPLPPVYPGPTATSTLISSDPHALLIGLSCSGACGDGNVFGYSIILSTPGQAALQEIGVSNQSSPSFPFTGLAANTAFTLEVSVTHNGQTSATVSSVVTTSKPTATISALSVADTSATLTVGCTNCGTAPDSFTVSATPVAGGPAITSNTNQISGLSSETTYSFSVVVAFAGTTSDVVLWQSNPVMTLPFVPIISAVSPPAVPLTGGSITVAGSNFTTSTELSLNGTTLSFTVVSGTQITFSAPSNTAGSYDLSITNPVGTYTLSNAITYVAGPTLVTNSPVLGTTNGGTIVTLTGTNLITTTQVNVGSTTVSFSVISNSVVRFVTAATSAGVVDIGVVTIGGAATLSSALEFTSSPLIPVVSSITPTSGPNSGGTLITVTGQYFSGSYSDSVSAAINGVSGSSVILIDDSTLTFVSPAGSAGAGLDVSVATGGGLGTLAGAFTYTAPPVPVTAGSAPTVVINTPTITEFSTREIPATGAEVTATGLRLENVSVLSLGGITVTMVSNTATSITFTTGEMPVGVWDLRLVASNGTLVFQQAIEVVEIQEITAQSSGELIGFAVTLRFTGNSRVLNDQQEGHLQRRLKSEADTIICWGYTTAQNPNSWALAHANARAQAACDLAVESMPGVTSFVRLRYGIPKDLAMRTSVQFWRVVE